MAIKLPPFGSFRDALNKAGVKTNSARGFWGGVTEDDDIVVTIWMHRKRPEGDRWPISKPRTNHGRLKDMWELGRIAPTVTVKVIMVRQRKDGSVKDAALLPGRWEIVDMVPRDDGKGVNGIVQQA